MYLLTLSSLPQYGDTLSNVVVVQFSEAVQTAMDLAYNLTCTITGPQDITVTSGTLGAGYFDTFFTIKNTIHGSDFSLSRSGQPVPIEYLPAEHTLDSRVRLLIKYQVEHIMFGKVGNNNLLLHRGVQQQP